MRRKTRRPNGNIMLLHFPDPHQNNQVPKSKKTVFSSYGTIMKPVLPKFANRIVPKPISLVHNGKKWLTADEIRQQVADKWKFADLKTKPETNAPSLITNPNGGLFQSPVSKQSLAQKSAPKKHFPTFHKPLLKKPRNHGERKAYVAQLNDVLKLERDLLIEIDFKSSKLSTSNLPVLKRKLEHAIRLVEGQIEMGEETSARDEIADLEDKRLRMQNMLDLVEVLS